MMSTQPLSSSALASLIWELQPQVAAQLLGPSPISSGAGVVVTPAVSKRLAKVFDYMRSKVWPAIIESANYTQIAIQRRTSIVDADDPLSVTRNIVTETVYAIITGPTVKDIERGLMTIADLKCLIAAATTSRLGAEDAIVADGVVYDIVSIQSFPQVPPAVAHGYVLRRAA